MNLISVLIRGAAQRRFTLPFENLIVSALEITEALITEEVESWTRIKLDRK